MNSTLQKPIPFSRKSLFLAPMEGITDSVYLKTINEIFGGIDYCSTYFLRIPTSGDYPDKHLIKHFGFENFKDPVLKKKINYQILTCPNGRIESTLPRLAPHFPWIDLNLGCPSKTVNKNGGGSILLDQPANLKNVISRIRKHYPHFFSAKIRVGYHSDERFVENLKILEGEGVDAITVHGRTRDQMYKGVANWKYIALATDTVKVPVIGNGDIWNLEDIEKIYKETGCHSLMVARGFLKTPWLGEIYKSSRNNSPYEENIEKLTSKYFKGMLESFAHGGVSEVVVLKRLKSLVRYIFEHQEDGEIKKRQFLRSKSLEELKSYLH